MILIASSTSDAYITNKIIETTRMVSGNTGRAGTLDLFKLYNESSSVPGVAEISRLLIKFDIGKASQLSSSTLDVRSQTFKAFLRLKNISTGQPVPNNFTVQVFPLAKPFSEGFGRDVISFSDVDSANFLSNSAGSLWSVSGAYKSGTVGDSGIDYYASGNLLDGNGTVNLGSTQVFETGTEDLVVDVTKVVSATIAGIIPNYGFRVSFIDSQEEDEVTRFVKRFASRHVREQSLRPSLLMSYDDSIVDNHSSSYFNLTSSLYLHNIARGEYSNIVSGASLTPVVGSNCLLVKFTTGSFTKHVTGSQLTQGGAIPGIYSASVAFYSSDPSVISGSTTISKALQASGSITFEEVWSSLDGTVPYFSGTLTVYNQLGNLRSSGYRKLRYSMLSTRSTVNKGTPLKIRAAFFDDYYQNRSSKFAYEPTPLVLSECRYRLRDVTSGKILFDFDVSGSRMSIDSLSPYATLYTDNLPIGVPLAFEFKITTEGETLEISSNNFRLVVNE